ncbi:hypothetical protein DFH09DRAFT_1372767 [Mycena vulgaris]|nr:hypothetical protein DFH09DRAFT_1372767 [Mycena vulgaris]
MLASSSRCHGPFRNRIWKERPHQDLMLNDLAAVARTCMAFYGPSIDFLWRFSTLASLLLCLPPDLVIVDTVTGKWGISKDRIRLVRPIRLSDWDRVLVYASRVRHLSSDPDYVELSATFPSIAFSLSDRMLPNLRGLDWRHEEGDFPYIQLFPDPRITSIYLPFYGYSALSLLSTLAPNLPNLQKLTSELLLLPTSASVSPTTDAEPFPSLRTLCLNADVETTVRFIRWCNHLSLVNFETLLARFGTADQTHALCTALAVGISHASVPKLRMDSSFQLVPGADSPLYLIRPASIRILFCFTNLTFVSILSPVGIDLDNVTVADMARARPQIESLCFAAYFPPIGSPRLSLEGLQSFADHCPQLWRIVKR